MSAAPETPRVRRTWSKPGLLPRDVKGHPDWLCRCALRGVHRGKYRLRVDFEDNVIKLVRAIGRKAHASGRGEGFITYRQLAELMYGADVVDDATFKRRRMCIYRWMRGAERAGLVGFDGATDPNNGADACMRWRQLDPLVDSIDPAGVAQSVEAPAISSALRVPASAPERRRDRWTLRCPRSGRRSVRRLRAPDDVLLSGSTKSVTPCRSSLASPGKNSLGRAHARGSGPGGPDRRASPVRLDAIEAACPPQHRAALRRWRTAGSEQEPRQALLGAADRGAVAAVPAALAAWALVFEGREPRLSRGMAAQLERSERQFDRLHGRGSAAGWIVHRIIVGAEPPLTDDFYEERRGGVHSLTWYVLQLKQLAHEARRQRRRMPAPKPWRPRGRA